MDRLERDELLSTAGLLEATGVERTTGNGVCDLTDVLLGRPPRRGVPPAAPGQPALRRGAPCGREQPSLRSHVLLALQLAHPTSAAALGPAPCSVRPAGPAERRGVLKKDNEASVGLEFRLLRWIPEGLQPRDPLGKRPTVDNAWQCRCRIGTCGPRGRIHRLCWRGRP